MATRSHVASFSRKGNAICEADNKKMEAAQDGQPGTLTAEEIQAFVKDTAIPTIQDEVGESKALKPPSELRDQVDQMLKKAQTVLNAATSDVSLFLGPDDPFASVNISTTKIGLTTCGG